MPQPLYLDQDVEPAYELRYSWSAWPSCPPLPVNAALLADLKPLWEADGIRVLEHRCSEKILQVTFSALPEVSPVFLAQRAKGRLQYALRQAKISFSGFSRKVSVNTVGHNCREQVEAYVASQVGTARFDDPSLCETLKEFTTVRPDVDLSHPPSRRMAATGTTSTWS